MELFNGNALLEVLDQKIENGTFIFKVRINNEFTAWYELDDELVQQFRVSKIISVDGKLFLIGIRRIQLWQYSIEKSVDATENY